MLIDQPSTKPTRKLTAAGAAAATVTLAVWIAGLTGFDVPPEVAAAATTLLMFIAGYVTRDELWWVAVEDFDDDAT